MILTALIALGGWIEKILTSKCMRMTILANGMFLVVTAKKFLSLKQKQALIIGLFRGSNLMNLIEQLGGYEKSKAFLNAASYTMDELIMMRRSGLRPQHVEKALLEHRREHGIFEVNDRVIILTMHIDNKLVHDVTKVLEDLIEVCGSYLYGSEIRHATDAEIKAGRRL